MSMDHKAFLFDTASFHQELAPVLREAALADEVDLLGAFIETHRAVILSPYSGEELEDDWQDEIRTKGVQEYADFALAKYYSSDEERGLSYLWQPLAEVLEACDSLSNGETYVVGIPFTSGSFTLDPGRMGMGFLDAEEIPTRLKELASARESISLDELDLSEELLDELSEDELLDAFDELIDLYRSALEANRGLLMTF
ncbi:hypothetical protein [Gorillibacterium sp. CAU 1737]|uniref:hypothetical protein n=1 Tax=Gorillibacterium sp. CAU 1737 TaxID=3140362 RepID=UPI0032611696